MLDPHHLKDLVEPAAHAAPFLVGAAQQPPRLSGARITEAVIIAAVVGALTAAYNAMVLLPEIKLSLQYQREATEREDVHIRERVEEIRRDVKDLQAQIQFIRAK